MRSALHLWFAGQKGLNVLFGDAKSAIAEYAIEFSRFTHPADFFFFGPQRTSSLCHGHFETGDSICYGEISLHGALPSDVGIYPQCGRSTDGWFGPVAPTGNDLSGSKPCSTDSHFTSALARTAPHGVLMLDADESDHMQSTERHPAKIANLSHSQSINARSSTQHGPMVLVGGLCHA